MFHLLFIIIGFFLFLATIGSASLAIVALLGFSYPLLDFFNHLQPFIFLSNLSLLFLVALFLKVKLWRSLAITIAATGFLSSAIIVIPDTLAKFVQQKTPIPKTEIATYKILTQNVFGQNYEMPKLANMIETQDPDIIAFQEYFREQRSVLHPLIKDKYPFFLICTGGKRENIAIYSKMEFEINSEDNCNLDDGRVSRIIAKFKGKDNREFIVITTHLDWPLQISKFNDGKNIFEGLDLSIARKRDQISDLSNRLKKIETPYLIVGDLNSTSWSYQLKKFAKKNDLSLRTTGFLTYPNRLHLAGKWRNVLPFLSLDHILSDENINVHKIKKGEPAGSDHNPIIMVFSVKDGE